MRACVLQVTSTCTDPAHTVAANMDSYGHCCDAPLPMRGAYAGGTAGPPTGKTCCGSSLVVADTDGEEDVCCESGTRGAPSADCSASPDFVQHGCGYALTSDMTTSVGTAADGFGSTLQQCRGRCVSAGYAFFGLGCPSATQTLCQCYSAARIGPLSAGLDTPETRSCANPAGECTPPASLAFGGKAYSLGGANVAAVYSTACNAHGGATDRDERRAYCTAADGSAACTPLRCALLDKSRCSPLDSPQRAAARDAQRTQCSHPRVQPARSAHHGGCRCVGVRALQVPGDRRRLRPQRLRLALRSARRARPLRHVRARAAHSLSDGLLIACE